MYHLFFSQLQGLAVADAHLSGSKGQARTHTSLYNINMHVVGRQTITASFGPHVQFSLKTCHFQGQVLTFNMHTCL